MLHLDLRAHFVYAGYTITADLFSLAFEKGFLNLHSFVFPLFACAYAFGPLLQSFYTQESGWRGTQHSDLPEALSVSVLITLILLGIQFFPQWGKNSWPLLKGLILGANKQPSY